MGVISKTLFGTVPSGQKVMLYTLQNNKGMTVRVMNYGAILVNCLVPDEKGVAEDVVLGYDNLEQYTDNVCFFGATIGPNANRIGGAKFVIGGKTCHLDVNDGPNNLHSHRELGYHKKLWDAVTHEEDNSITFLLKAPDGEMGFPGNKHLSLTYRLTDNNELFLHYHAFSDAPTVINMTNHTYFNLSGQGKGDIRGHILTLYAQSYTPVAAGAIPTGKISPVKDTPMDFSEPRPIGERIDNNCEQLKLTGGYDHNWVIDGDSGAVRLFAQVCDPVSGRCMKAYTDLPGVQFYAGNGIQDEKGKGGCIYQTRAGFCLETQYFPDTPNVPDFPSSEFGPDREYDTTTIYQFL